MSSLSLLQEHSDERHAQQLAHNTEEWMLICQCNSELQQHSEGGAEIDWTMAAHQYTNLEEALSFISNKDRHRNKFILQLLQTQTCFKGNN